MMPRTSWTRRVRPTCYCRDFVPKKVLKIGQAEIIILPSPVSRFFSLRKISLVPKTVGKFQHFVLDLNGHVLES